MPPTAALFIGMITIPLVSIPSNAPCAGTVAVAPDAAVSLRLFLRLSMEGGGLVSIAGAASRPIDDPYRIAGFPGDPPAPVTRDAP